MRKKNLRGSTKLFWASEGVAEFYFVETCVVSQHKQWKNLNTISIAGVSLTSAFSSFLLRVAL